jgi:hypothetical protein
MITADPPPQQTASPAPQKPALLTRPQCAKAIPVSVRKLDDMTKKRQVPCFRLGGKILYSLPRVLAALDKLEQQEAHRQ